MMRVILLVLVMLLSGCWYAYDHQTAMPSTRTAGTHYNGSGWGYEMSQAVREAEKNAQQNSNWPMMTISEDVSCAYRVLYVIPVAALFPLCHATVERVEMRPARQGQ